MGQPDHVTSVTVITICKVHQKLRIKWIFIIENKNREKCKKGLSITENPFQILVFE